MQTIISTRNAFYIIIMLMVFFYCHTIAIAAPQVKTDKDTYAAGETIQVNFYNAPGNNSDWICVVPVGAPDTEGGDFKWMPRGLSDGVLTFDVPEQGKYEVRAYYDYKRNGYVVSARYGFTVVNKLSLPSPVVAILEVIKPSEKPPEEYSTGGTSQLSVAVFQFTPLSMDATNYGLTVTNTLIDAPKIQTALNVLARKDLEIFLFNNNLQQNDQTDNMIEIGTMLGLDYVIAGNIEKKGAIIVTNCKVVSMTGRNVIYTNKLVSTGDADLINNVKKMSDAIIQSIRRGAN